MRTILTIVFFLIAQTAIADTLCGNKPKEHDLVIGESQYTYEKSMSANSYIREEVPKMIIKNHDSLKALIKSNKKISSSELFENDMALEQVFFIDYPNNFQIITGTLLKQNALILKYKYAKSKKVSDKKAYLAALKEFCEFESGASYVD